MKPPIAGYGPADGTRWWTGAAVGWFTARVAVVAALALSRYLVNQLGAADPTGRPPSGLLGWDAGWYVRIVESGYGFLPWEAVRFFPLLPLVASAFDWLVGSRAAVLLAVNGAALASGLVIARLARLERGDDRLASRAGWLLALLPPAFVLVMGYAEALLVLTSSLMFFALRTGRFGWAALAGFFAGLSRPLGVLLVVPALVEAARGLRAERSWPARLARAAAVVSPVAGAATFLAWCYVSFDAPLRPLQVQQGSDRRGDFANPITRLLEAGRDLVGGVDVGSGLHLPWAIGFLALTVVLLRRWPVSYGLYTAVVVVVALSADNLDSLERYGLSAFPIVLAAADLCAPPWLERAVLVAATAGLVMYSTLAFLGAYVP